MRHHHHLASSFFLLSSPILLLLLLLPTETQGFINPHALSPLSTTTRTSKMTSSSRRASSRPSRSRGALYAQQQQDEKDKKDSGWFKSEWRDDDELFVPGLTTSELPDSFEDALQLAVDSAKQAFAAGRARVRIDFDTTAGDLTYTTLKNSLPLALAFAQYMGDEVLQEEKLVYEGEGDDKKIVGYEGTRLTVIFPDTGSAVWSTQDWKAGKFSKSAKVPPSVRCAAFPNEMVDPERDTTFLIVCPRASEAPATYELLTSLPPDTKVVLMNPELINAEVVGFGMAGRRIRDEVENKFERAYYLKTLSWGALTRRWPAGFSIWLEDEKEEEGYRLLKTVGRFPSMDEMEDIRMAGDNGGGENRGMLSELARFIDGFRRI